MIHVTSQGSTFNEGSIRPGDRILALNGKALHDTTLPQLQSLLYAQDGDTVFTVGMVSHEISLITIFGHKNFRQKFFKNLTFFTKKFQQPLILIHIWYQISNFEAKLPQK